MKDVKIVKHSPKYTSMFVQLGDEEVRAAWGCWGMREVVGSVVKL